jgi:hypothetical protein
VAHKPSRQELTPYLCRAANDGSGRASRPLSLSRGMTGHGDVTGAMDVPAEHARTAGTRTSGLLMRFYANVAVTGLSNHPEPRVRGLWRQATASGLYTFPRDDPSLFLPRYLLGAARLRPLAGYLVIVGSAATIGFAIAALVAR